MLVCLTLLFMLWLDRGYSDGQGVIDLWSGSQQQSNQQSSPPNCCLISWRDRNILCFLITSCACIECNFFNCSCPCLPLLQGQIMPTWIQGSGNLELHLQAAEMMNKKISKFINLTIWHKSLEHKNLLTPPPPLLKEKRRRKYHDLSWNKHVYPKDPLQPTPIPELVVLFWHAFNFRRWCLQLVKFVKFLEILFVENGQGILNIEYSGSNFPCTKKLFPHIHGHNLKKFKSV